MSDNYKKSGVDVELASQIIEDVKPAIAKTQNLGSKLGSVGGFGALFALSPYLQDLTEPVLVSSTDGVGTKLEIANKMGQHSSIGQDLVAMCVNDVIVQGATPLFFLDYFATGKLDKTTTTQVITSIAQACQLASCALIGGETAEMPGLYQQGDYDIAGFAVGIAERQNILPKLDAIKQGDCIIGMSSSGLHSNGFSLVRHIIKQAGVDLGDVIAEISATQTLGQILLTPTRIYVKACLELIKYGNASDAGVNNVDGVNNARVGDDRVGDAVVGGGGSGGLKGNIVKAFCHITGGGFYENLPRILPQNLIAKIDSSKFPRPAIFKWLQKSGDIPKQEMFKTFNCGIGMVAITAVEDATKTLEILQATGQDAYIIGHIEKGDNTEEGKVKID